MRKTSWLLKAGCSGAAEPACMIGMLSVWERSGTNEGQQVISHMTLLQRVAINFRKGTYLICLLCQRCQWALPAAGRG